MRTACTFLLFILSLTPVLAQDRIGLYSGTFDPVHNGHLKLVEMAVKCGKLDLVYVYPNYNPNHKTPILNFKQRYELLEVAVANTPYIKLPKIETLEQILNAQEPNTSMYDWVMQNSSPHTKFFRLMGADSFKKFLSYPRAVDAIENDIRLNLIVSERKGHKVKIPEQLLDKVTVIKLRGSKKYSSSKFRTDPKKYQYMLPAKVFKKISEKQYYQSDTSDDSIMTMFKSLF